MEDILFKEVFDPFNKYAKELEANLKAATVAGNAFLEACKKIEELIKSNENV